MDKKGKWITKNNHPIFIEYDEEYEEITLKDALMQKISKFNVPTIRLNSKEYAIMLKAFNETYYSKNKSKSVCFVYTNIGYAYIVENMGYNTPRVLARKKIK